MKPDIEYRGKKPARANTGTRIEKGGYVPIGSDEPRSPPKGAAVVKSNPTSAQLARLAELEAKAAHRREQIRENVRRCRAKKKQSGETK